MSSQPSGPGYRSQRVFSKNRQQGAESAGAGWARLD